MLVYGDRWTVTTPAALIAQVEAALAAAAAATGIERQDLLTRALVRAGELAQGVADAEFGRRGFDDATPAQEACIGVAVAVARSLIGCARVAEAQTALARLGPLPPLVRCKTPEGYAFYGVYPEAYAAAAAAHDWGERPLILGLRSIGTSLAAVVAAQTGGQIVTLRPCGHPFRRELRLSDTLRARLSSHGGCFAVVDEGPGLSGSSFGAAADLLEALGASPDRIVFMPSHASDLGSQASPRHRARWASATRLVGVSGVSAEAVARWFPDATGPVDLVEDLSAGAWRTDWPQAPRPPAAPATERLKFRLTARGGRYLVRFAGLGHIGDGKLELARSLHAAGFAPEPLAVRRGFLLERWSEGEPVTAGALRQPSMLAQVARYLGFRARALPAAAAEGGDWASLREMARVNAAELAGAAASARVDAEIARLEPLTGFRPVRIDGRLQAWEWRRRRDGSLCKTDALDHAATHDLVGCQDVAWDLAGAAVELALSDRETEALRRRVAAEAGRGVDPNAVAAFRLCYAAFQAGFWQMAAEASPRERARAEIERDRYVASFPAI